MSTEKTARDTLANLNNFVYKNKGDNEIVSLVKSIKSQLSSVTILATSPDNDFKDVQANGYRTAVRSVSKLVEAAVDSHELAYLRFAELYFKWVLVCASNNNALEPLVGAQVYEFMADYRSRREDLKIILGPFPAKLYLGIWGQLGDYMQNSQAIVKVTGFWSYTKFVFSASYRKELLLSAILDSDVWYWKKFLAFAENKLIRRRNQASNAKKYPEIEIKELFLELKSRWTIELDGKIVTIVEGSRIAPKKIRCKVYSSELGPIKKTKLVIHAHGGGFVGISIETMESNLLSYAERLADAIIVSVDYSLVPEARFPTQLQQMLDVYLWATASSCPLFPDGLDSAVATGDSAGGNLTTALVMVLADIRSQWSPTDLVMPSLVAIYPAFTVAFEYHPSLIMSLIDTLLAPVGMTMMMGNYLPSDFKIQPHDLENKLTDELEAVKVFKVLHKHPYVSPLFCEPEKMKDIKLSIVTSNACPLLDHSVLMAKRWQGPVTLDVFEGLAHGFMQTANVCELSMAAFNRVIRRISENLCNRRAL